MKFSAVILAGGESSRMGRDKAFLEFDGQTLLARQVQLARDAGADEVFISGRAGVDYSSFSCPMLHDSLQNSGPLAGIASALDAITTPLLLVLAVDTPHLNVELLQQLAKHCTPSIGTVPRVGGRIEPLAAMYPKAALTVLEQLLLSPPARLGKSPSAKAFAERCVTSGLARFVELPTNEAIHFTNWNAPADLPCLT